MMISRKYLVVVAVVIVAVVGTMAFFLVASPSSLFGKNALLDQTVTLTSTGYERWFYLNLTQGDRLYVQISVTGVPIDFIIYNQAAQMCWNATGTLSVQQHWTVPSSGTYAFYVVLGGALGDYATVHLTVTKE